MLKASVFLLLFTAVIFDPSSAETTEDCVSYVEDRLQDLLAMDASIRDTMCELLQDFAACVYRSANRSVSAVESSKFIRLVEHALRNSGESGKVCQIDVDGITGGGENVSERDKRTREEISTKIRQCFSNFSDQIDHLTSEDQACQLLDNAVLCILTAIPRRPTTAEIDSVEAIVSAALPEGISCDVDLNAIVKELWWTAKDCMSDAEKQLQNILAMNVSIRDNVCNITQNLNRCVDLTEKRRLTAEESAAFLNLTRDALVRRGETGRICESDVIVNATVTGDGDNGSAGDDNTTDPSVAETAQDCTDNVESRLQALLATDDSVRDDMCDLNQEHARCIYMTENRRRSPEESRKFITLIEDALLKSGETGRVCELDMNAIMGEGSDQGDGTTEDMGPKITQCTSEAEQKVTDMARSDSGLGESKYCRVINEMIQCLLNAIPRRPTAEEISQFKAAMRRGEELTGLSCDINVEAAVNEYWKGRSDGENGASGLILKKSGQLFHWLWLVLASVTIHTLVKTRFC